MIANAAPSQPATFYFHKQSSRTLNNVTTALWANTTLAWSGSTQTDVRSGIKSGIPAVWDFYSQPAIAGNVTLTGPLTFNVYLGSSAVTGSTTVITGTVTEITALDIPIPLATASTTIPIGTSIALYSFSINSNVYLITAGAILHFTVTVTVPGGSAKTLTLYYDTGALRSGVSLSFQNRIGVTSFNSYNQTGVVTLSFSRNWTATGRLVSLRTVAFDALGLYDIALVNTTVVSPSGSSYIANTPLVRTQGGSASYAGTWMFNFTYAVNDRGGLYTSNLQFTDNGGLLIGSQLQFSIYANWLLTFRTLSSDASALPVSSVVVTLFIGSNGVYTGTSNTAGMVSPGPILVRDDTTYSINSYYESSLANQTSNYAPSGSMIMPIYLSVYRTDLSQVFRNGDNTPLSQSISSLLVTMGNGTIANLDPSQAYLLASGQYTVDQAIVRGVNVVPSPTPIFNPKNGPFTIDLQVYQLTVIVEDQNNHALGNAQVGLSLSGVTIYQGTTAADGSLVIQDLPKGQYLVTVTSGSTSDTSTVTISQDTTGRIQVSPPSTPPVASGPDWAGQTLGWIVLAGAVVSGLVGYREYTQHAKLAVKQEPFETYLNNLIPGGIRDGEATLIYGADGTGKTTVCEQLAYKSLLEGHPTVFLTYESSQAIRESMKSFHWDPSVYETQQFFQLIDCEVQAPGQSMGVLENFYDVAALNLNIASALDNATTKPRLFIDSLTDLALKSNSISVTGMVTETKDRVKSLQGQFYMTIEKSVPRSILAKIGDASENIIELEHREENGKGFISFTVRKSHGSRVEVGTPVKLLAIPGKGLVFETRKNTPKPITPIASPNTFTGPTTSSS